MDPEKLTELYHSLGHGDSVAVVFDSGIRSGTGMVLKVTSRHRLVGKNKSVGRIIFKEAGDPRKRGIFYWYLRKGRVSMAWLDMAVSLRTAVRVGRGK